MKTPTVRQYIKKLQDLSPDDPELDEYLDEVAEDADELSESISRKRVAKALLAAAAALEATALEAATSADDLVKDMEDVKDQIDKAIALAKRKQFDKAQDAFESALFSGSTILQADFFREAEVVEQGEGEGEVDYPPWAR